MNRQALRRMKAPVRLDTIAGATHVFEEPGTLEQVAQFAREWFARYLVSGAGAGSPG
jgi:putative phosphoribosyl transferase